ncbi:DUF3616 domain-containing protein [Aquincola sp. S2]|uniref:DUF3616 domain-containing protein n=1 Tax=Pseudaquabacterium terrae TaxID=2732868 RepID=A0ABX2ETB2_9BURK|nr:DUF3616 domain-containing protein [Aquabacterium terrae]NRF71740.1 DUF3616 domain-containing protein [Aquabacterium terrae]
MDADHFAVADDEHNTLRIYRRGTPSPVDSLVLDAFLGTERESDLEGAATIGNVTYWIASNGSDKTGKRRVERHRLFATEILPGMPPVLRPFGKDYRNLIDDLTKAPTLQSYRIDAAARLAPDAPGGLNIEGLAATAEGHLLVGFRNPVPGGKALLVPIENPGELLRGKSAKIGNPVELTLDGRGIRSIDWVGLYYLIVAGAPSDRDSFALYRWSGKSDHVPAQIAVNFQSLRPEALSVIPGTRRVQILSDDGTIDVGGVPCKKLQQAKRSFRSLTIELE